MVHRARSWEVVGATLLGGKVISVQSAGSGLMVQDTGGTLTCESFEGTADCSFKK